MIEEDWAVPPARAYRVMGFQRVGLPIVGFLLIAVGVATVQRQEFVGVIPVVLGALFVYAPMRCQLLVSKQGIESRMFRPSNNFRYPWRDVNNFELIGNGYQCAILVNLRDGTRRLLPSTRAWMFEKPDLEHTLGELEEARRAAEAATPL